MSLTAPLSIQTAYLTDPGMVRDENQDACFELRGPAGEALLLVADGMGGHQGGATASRMVVETAREFFELAPHWSGDLLRDAITEANSRIRRAASQQSELMGMGTTVVAMLFGGGATTKPLKKKVKRPGEKAPHELPLARWDGIGFREEVHQGKKQLNR